MEIACGFHILLLYMRDELKNIKTIMLKDTILNIIKGTIQGTKLGP